MSATIDQRIVEMRFDNSQFERNVSTTMSTLDKLKQNLNMSDASRGLENVNRAARNFNMSGLSNAVETVHAKFSALEIMGITALTNITNSAVNAGKKIVSALTIDPVKTGFQEYETQINSVQTILANTKSKGTTLEDVNQALDELNKYADMTIYNFTQMTKNIGTFTAAGVDLDTSVSAIKGIANLAAVSGSTSQQASTAMYQLSQALATGTVRLQDWNSVVNAGMGGEVFQNALKRTATVMGTDVDALIKKYGSFRESLTRGGWLTTDVLNETLKQFTLAAKKGSKEWEEFKQSLKEQGYTEAQADEILEMANTATEAATKVKTFTQLWDTLKETAQSGWTQTWEIVIGDFEEAKESLSKVSDVLGEAINGMSNARNNLLDGAFTSKWDQLTAKVEAAGISTEDFQSKLKEVAKEHNIAVDDLIEEYGSLGKAVSAGKIPTDVIKETIKKLVGVSDAAGVAAGKTEEYGEIVKRVINGEFGTGKERMEALTKAGYDYATVQNLVNEKLGVSAKHLSELSDEQLKNTEQLSNLSDEQLKNKGYTEEQITALRELQKAAEEGSTSINDLVNDLTKPSGRELLIESISNAFKSLVTIFQSVRDAWKEIFPPMTSDQLYSIIEAIRDFSKQLVIGEETADKLKRTFKGVFAVVDIFKQAISAVLGVVPSLFGGVTELGGGILTLTASWGDWLVKLNETVKASGIFTTASQAISTVIDNIIQVIKTGVKYVQDFINNLKANISFPGLELFHTLLSKAQERLSYFTKSYDGTKDTIVSITDSLGEGLEENKFVNALQALWTGVTKITSGIASVLGKFMNGALTKIANFDYSGIFDFVNTLSISGIGVMLAKITHGISGVTGILDSVRGCFEAYQSQLQAGALIKIATAIGILAAAIVVISLIDSVKLAASLAAITGLFGDLMGSMFIMSKISGIKDVMKTITLMQGMSIAVLILAAALKTVGTMEFGDMAKGLVGIVALTGTLVGAMVLLSKFANKAVKGAVQMVIFAAAIKVLASACKDLSTLSWEQLAKGLVGVGVLLAEVSLFLRTAKFSGKSIMTATGIVILAGAIKILASACKDFGQMSVKEIGKGLIAIGALLAEVALFTNLTGNAKHVISTGIALVAIAGAMKIFASAMSDFGKMKWDTIGRGLAAMAGSLLLVTAAVRLMPSNALGVGVGLIAIGAALLIVAEAMKNMGGMQWDAIGRGLVVLGGSLGIIAVAVNAMRGALAGVAALVVVVGALALLTPVLSVLGAMPIANIGKALLTLAATFAVIGVAGLLLKPVVTTLLAFGATIALVGAGVALIGAGLLAAGAGLSAIAVGFTALVTAIAGGAAAIVASLTVIVTGILSLVPSILAIIGSTLVGICQVIIDAAPAIFETVTVLISGLVSTLVTLTPILAAGILEILVGVMTALVAYTPQIVELLFDFVIKIIDALAVKLPELVASVVNLFVSFFKGVVEAFGSIDTSSLVTALLGVGMLAAMFAAFAGLAAIAPMAMTGVLAMGIVILELTAVLAAIGAIAQIPGLDWLIGEGGQLLQSIGTAIGQFVGGLVGGFASGVTSQFPQIGTDLSGFMTNLAPFIEGAKNIDASSMEAVKTLAEAILVLTGANILEGLTSFITGGSSLTSFGAELAEFAPYFNQYYQGIKGIDATVITASSNAALALAEMASKLPNVGGLASWFAGENDMTVFGDQLVPFGASMLAYSQAVAGIDVEAVTNSATAAMSLAELANKLPNAGGLVSWFAGENDMEAFGDQLVPFGASMLAYSQSVVGMDQEAVTNSATAALALAELANKLPNNGGIVSWFAGDNDMKTFGNQLVPFGQGMKSYADSIIGMDSAAVTNSATAALALAELANNLPNSGGLGSLFTGDNDISSFGTKLVPFGQGMKAYSDSVAGINGSAITSSVKAANDLVGAIKNMSGINTSGVNSFVKAVDSLSKTNISGFVSTFSNASDKLKTVGVDMIKYIAEGLKAKASSLDSVAIDIADRLSNSIRSRQTVITNTMSEIVTSINTAITSKKQIFTTSGTDIINAFAQGITTNKAKVASTITPVLDSAVTSMKGYYFKFQDAGKHLVNGFVNGIDTNMYKASAKSKAMAKAAKEAAEKELGIQSPSKEFEQIGKYVDDGMAIGINKNSGKVEQASEDMAQLSLEATLKEIQNGNKEFTKEIDNYWDTLLDNNKKGSDAKKYQDMDRVKFEESILNDSLNTWGKYTTELDKTTKEIIEKNEIFTDEMSDTDKLALATQKASEQLTDLQKETEDKLSGIFGGTNVNAAEFGKVFNGSIESIEAYVTYSTARMSKTVETAKETSEQITKLSLKDTLKEIQNGNKAFTKEIDNYWDTLLATNKKGANAKKYQDMDRAKFEKHILNESLDVWGKYTTELDKTTKEIIEKNEIFTDEMTDNDKLVIATKKATEQLTDLQKETEDKLSGMFGGLSVNALEFGSVFNGSIEAIEAYVTYTIAQMPKTAEAAKSASQLALEAIKSGDKEIIKEVDSHWSKLLDAHKKGADKKKYQDMKLVDFEKQILEETKNIWSNYTNELSSNANSIMNEVDIFSKIEKQENVVSKADMTKNLKEQIVAYKEYAELLATLNARISNDKLKEVINNMGVDSIQQLKVINSMTDAELTDYAALYDMKFAYATNAAATQLGKLQTETEAKLSELYGGAKVDALEFGKTFDGSMESIEAYVIASVNPDRFKAAGKNITEGIGKGMSASKAGEKAATETIDDIEKAAKTAAEIHSPSRLFNREVGANIVAGMANGILDNTTEVTNASSLTITEALREITSAYDRFYGAGEYLVRGFIEGIHENINSAASKATAMADAVTKATKKALNIHSPSRVFYELGEYTGQGFVNALRDYETQAYKSGSGIAEQARKGMNTVVNKINDAINGDMDVQPTIRPLMDLSDIESGASAIANMFNSRHSIGVLSNVGAINSMMNQNGVSGESEIVSAIDKLRKDISNIGGPSYSIDRITYDDGSNIADAMKSIVRAATIERRK